MIASTDSSLASILIERTLEQIRPSTPPGDADHTARPTEAHCGRFLYEPSELHANGVLVATPYRVKSNLRPSSSLLLEEKEILMACTPRKVA